MKTTSRPIPVRLLLLGVAFVAVCHAASPAPSPFTEGDRWCVLGDSITHGGFYPRYVELFYVTRFPDRKLEIFNCGISGDTVTGALKRLGWDCLDHKPTVVSVMLGMNDVGRHHYATNADAATVGAKRSERDHAYAAAMTDLSSRILTSGARLILITPSPYDDTAREVGTVCFSPNAPGCGAALRRYAAKVMEWGRSLGVPVIDFNGPMNLINEEHQRNDPAFTIVGSDRVHPKEPGHLVMAFEFLKAQGVSGDVSRMEIDAVTGSSTGSFNCTISDCKLLTNGISFTSLEKSLPFPASAAAAPALQLVPFSSDLNREILIIKGLRSGNYRLSIDGTPIRNCTASELSSGVNLSTETNTPEYLQSLRVMEALKRKWEAVSAIRGIAYVELQSWPDAPRPFDPEIMGIKMKEREARLAAGGNPWVLLQQENYRANKPREEDLKRQSEEALQAAREAAKPVPHRFTILLEEPGESSSKE